MADFYLWIKAIHIIAMVAWMAGLLYLPRLFVYHIDHSEPNTPQWEMFVTMEKRLLKIILMPAILITFIAGFSLVHILGKSLFIGGIWFHIKFILALTLAAFHGWAAREVKKLARGEKPRKSTFYRYANEIPAILMAAIIILVIVRPI